MQEEQSPAKIFSDVVREAYSLQGIILTPDRHAQLTVEAYITFVVKHLIASKGNEMPFDWSNISIV